VSKVIRRFVGNSTRAGPSYNTIFLLRSTTSTSVPDSLPHFVWKASQHTSAPLNCIAVSLKGLRWWDVRNTTTLSEINAIIIKLIKQRRPNNE
jgi:hypothetical protein